MKSTLTKRGCHFKSSGYRVVLLLGQLRPQYSYSQKCNTPIMGFIGLAIALPPPSVHEVRLETDMFVTKLAFDFKIAHCEAKVSELLDYSAEDLNGKSMYALVHPADVDKIKQTHNDLIKKGQVMSTYFRLLNRRGGYTWMQMCATLVCNTKNENEQSILCVNYVLSGSQYGHVVMDHKQVDQPTVRIKRDEDAENQLGSPESRDGEYSNQGSEGGRNPVNLGLDQSLESYTAQGYNPEDPHLRLGQTPVEAPNTGLSGEEQDRQSPAGPDPSNTSNISTTSSTVTSSTSTTIRPHSASPLAASSPASPDCESSKVRELESAMSRHLPAEKCEGGGPASQPASQTSPASLLKHFYSRPGGYPEPSWLPSSAYPGVPPAQPLAIKPYGGVETSAYPGLDQNIYSHSASFHLYNRGQTWYSGN